MTVTPTLTVQIDTAEPRVTLASQAVVVDGRIWDSNLSTAFVDPISRTAFLMPLCRTDAWLTSGCGRLGKSAFTFQGSPDHWVQHNKANSVDSYLTALGVNEGVTTNATWGVNQPFVLEWFSFGSGTDDFVQMECGWSDGTLPYNPSTGSTPDIRLRFYTSGKCEIFKNGNFVGEGNIFERKVTSQNAYAKVTTTASKGDHKQLVQQTVQVLLIPCRHRSLLILSNQGGGFEYIFEDIDPNDPAPTITGAGKFFWYVPQGQATAQLAPLLMQTSGYVVSLQTAFREAPASEASPQIQAYWDAPGFGSTNVVASLVQADGVSAFVANGSNRVCKVRLDLSGDGTASPFAYGAAGVFPSVQATTDSLHATTLDSYIKHSSLSVPESPTDVQYTMTLKSPHALEQAGASKIRVVGNRPLVAKIGTIAFLTGRTKMPSWSEAINDTARELVLETRDRCMANEMHRIKNPVPIDGSNLRDALGYFVQMPGYSSGDVDIQSISYSLPTTGQTSEGDWALLPEVGDTSLMWIQKLWETFARNYSWGWVPRATGPKFRFYDLPTLNAQAVSATLYGTVAEALTAGVDRTQLPAHCYRAYHEAPPFVEANDIWVTGRNPKTGKALQTHYADTASQNPTLAPAARPDNWCGEIWYYGWVDSAITTLADGAYCCEQLARRLTGRRVLGSFVSDFLLRTDGAPVWRNDTVRLVGLGTYRIVSLEADIKREHAQAVGELWPDMIWRPTTYCVEQISSEGPYGTYAS